MQTSRASVIHVAKTQTLDGTDNANFFLRIPTATKLLPLVLHVGTSFIDKVKLDWLDLNSMLGRGNKIIKGCHQI